MGRVKWGKAVLGLAITRKFLGLISYFVILFVVVLLLFLKTYHIYNNRNIKVEIIKGFSSVLKTEKVIIYSVLTYFKYFLKPSL